MTIMITLQRKKYLKKNYCNKRNPSINRQKFANLYNLFYSFNRLTFESYIYIYIHWHIFTTKPTTAKIITKL